MYAADLPHSWALIPRQMIESVPSKICPKPRHLDGAFENISDLEIGPFLPPGTREIHHIVLDLSNQSEAGPNSALDPLPILRNDCTTAVKSAASASTRSEVIWATEPDQGSGEPGR